jgi:hypothetical protein
LGQNDRRGKIGLALPINLALADKMSQVPDENGQSATISKSENSDYSSKIESTNEEILPDTILNERSPDSSVVENVAQLAKLYAIGTPSEKEFQTDQGANPSVIRGLSRAKADMSCPNAPSVRMPRRSFHCAIARANRAPREELAAMPFYSCSA